MTTPGSLADESSSLFRLLTAAPRLRELTGAFNLVSHYGLRDQYETFCKKPLPSSVAESHYLLNVVGSTDIRKGEGMELGQLLHAPDPNISDVPMQPFDLDVLRQAFTLRESGPISLPEADCGLPTISSKAKDEQKEKEKKHKKRKKRKEHKEHRKDKDKDRRKDRDKERDREKYKDKDHSKKRENGEDHTKKHHKKKRKHEGDEEEGEVHKHKKKKHKHSSKTEVPELAKKGK
eukprot:c28001_g1_i1 orf=189-890(+)